MLILAGGANDIPRHLHLGVGERRTETKHYCVVVVEKGTTLRSLTISTIEEVHGPFTELAKHFSATTVNSIVANSQCPAVNTLLKWKDIGTRILATGGAGGQFHMPFMFSKFDNLQFEIIAPPVLAEFNIGSDSDTNYERDVLKELHGQYPTVCAELKARVNRLFFAAIIRYTIEVVDGGNHPLHRYKDNLLNIDAEGNLTTQQPDSLNFQPAPINATVFPLAQASMRAGAAYYVAHSVVALVFVVGDALVNPHFFSGSGLTTARSGVWRMIAVLAALYPRLTLMQAARQQALWKLPVRKGSTSPAIPLLPSPPRSWPCG